MFQHCFLIKESRVGFEIFLAKRYLRSPRKDRSISIITKIAVGGVAVGVLVLITALSMMNGMEKEMREALRGAESDLTVYSMGGFPWGADNQLIDQIKETVEIKAFAPFTTHTGLIMGPQKPGGTLVKGIDARREAEVGPIKFYVRTESFEYKRDNSNPDRKMADIELQKSQQILTQLEPHLESVKDADGNLRKTKITGIIVGSQLARNLEVEIGDFVTLMSLETRMSPLGDIPLSKRFKVVGFFESGLPGYDELVSYIDINIAQKIFRMQGHISGLTLSVEDGDKADAYKELLREKIGFPYFFTTWMENNKNMFATFRLERIALSIILTLIILLASFLIVSSLIMLVVEKRKDIAILKAMGAKNSSIRKIFIYQGSLIGLTGTIVGVILGLIVCWVISRFDIIDIPPGVYVGNRIPMHVEVWQIFLITAVSLLICFFVTIIPSMKASNLDPVEGMRNE